MEAVVTAEKTEISDGCARRRVTFIGPPADKRARDERIPQPGDADVAPPGTSRDPIEGMATLALQLNAPVGQRFTEEDREQALQRYAVIEPLLFPERFEKLWSDAGGRKGSMVGALCKQHQVSRTTLYLWLDSWHQNGLAGLARKSRRDAGQPRSLNPAALDFLIAAALPCKGIYGRLSVKEIYRAYQEEREWRKCHAGYIVAEFEQSKYARYLDAAGRLSQDALLPESSYETFRNWHDRIPEVLRIYAQEGVESYANTQEILSWRAIAEIKPLDFLVMDHRMLDLLCMIPIRGGWRLGRPWLTASLDMRCRKWLSWRVVETPSSDSIAAVLRSAFVRHGLPKAAYWDNGRDFRAVWFEGGRPVERQVERIGEMPAPWNGVLDALGVRIHHAIVRRARSKLIEPAFRATALFDETLPWYCGNKPSARPERLDDLIREHERWLKGEESESPFPTIDQISELYDRLLESLNEREHVGEGMRKITATGWGWYSPNELWESLIAGVEQRSVPSDVLHLAFAKRKVLTVRNGELRVTLGGRLYHYRLTENPLGLMGLNGCEVELAYDPIDMGLAAVYFENRFRGFVSAVELRRMGEKDFVADERDRRAARRTVRKYIEAVHASTPIAGPVERLQRWVEIARPRVDPPRVEIMVAVPDAILDAAQAAKREYDNSTPEPDPTCVPIERRAVDPDEGAFSFFGGADDE
ncbi:MAG: helix-turn-helix domain-containing protein [Bryobacteraceae bacterium]|jgi:transposase InsO family protein/transposase-like protein